MTDSPSPEERLEGLEFEEVEPPPTDDDPGPNGRADEQPPPPLPFINMSTWDDEPPPQREWAVPEVIPIDQPTLFSGEGSAGKTLVELNLAAAHALGREWLGLFTVQGPAIYLGAEDVVNEMRRRTYDITRYYGVKFADLISGGLNLLSYAGEDCLLGVASRKTGIIEPTTLYKSLLEAARDIKPKHIGIDTSADVFGGNEIDRTQVRQFVSLLRKLTIVANGSLVLLSHPSLTGIVSDSGLSGSTAWHNSVRSRFYLKSPTNNESRDSNEYADETKSDLRELVFKKNNYGLISKSITLRYNNGLFLPVGGSGRLSKLAREQGADEQFLILLRRIVEQGRNVSSKNKASIYAPTFFANLPNNGGFSSKEFTQAMERLLQRRAIHIVTEGPRSKQRDRIVEGPPPS
jgi:RecA-family ATPase